MNFKSKNSFKSLDKLEISGKTYHFYNLIKAEENGLKDIKRLPFKEIHFFPILPLPLVCFSVVIKVGCKIFFLISFAMKK